MSALAKGARCPMETKSGTSGGGGSASDVSVGRISGVGGEVAEGRLSTCGGCVSIAGSRVVNGSTPTSNVPHPAAKIEIKPRSKNNDLSDLLIFISGTFKFQIAIDYPVIRIYQRDVTEKSLSCHRLVT